MTEHTPTPWHVGATKHTELVMGFRNNVEFVIAELDTEIDATMAENEANAAFIVRAVNNHQLLADALKEAVLQIEYMQERLSTSTGVAVLSRSNHLLALVEGKRP